MFSGKLQGILTVLLTMFGATSAHAAIVSYNASGNSLPTDPPFTLFDNNFPILGPLLGGAATHTVSGGAYEMGLTQRSKYTFWFTDDLTLDDTQTVEINARLKYIAGDSGNPTDRAGLGIALTDHQNFYNELYIADDEIFLNQRSGTTRVRDESYAMDTTSAFHDYTFRVHNDVITILVDGVQRLTGAMFDTAGLSGVPTLPNWASIGDITSSAEAQWQTESWSVSVVPEPAHVALAIGSLTLLKRRGLFRRGSQTRASWRSNVPSP